MTLAPLTSAQARRPLTAGHIDEFAEAIATVLRPLLKRIEKLEKELEARNDFVDRGVWSAGLVARKNHGVTHEGSYWICQKATMEKPGHNSDWRLAVKRGRDGK